MAMLPPSKSDFWPSEDDYYRSMSRMKDSLPVPPLRPESTSKATQTELSGLDLMYESYRRNLWIQIYLEAFKRLGTDVSFAATIAKDTLQQYDEFFAKEQ